LAAIVERAVWACPERPNATKFAEKLVRAAAPKKEVDVFERRRSIEEEISHDSSGDKAFDPPVLGEKALDDAKSRP
jgi:hypothetical protein